MLAALRHMPTAVVCVLAALLLASCGVQQQSGGSASPAPTVPSGRPPEWVASHVARILKPLGQVDSIEWVKLASPPRKGHLQDVSLLAHGATAISGWGGAVDYPAGVDVRSRGWYVLAAQGQFTTRLGGNATPVPVSTVLLLLHAVVADGRNAMTETQGEAYGEGVHLDLKGTQVYRDAESPAAARTD